MQVSVPSAARFGSPLTGASRKSPPQCYLRTFPFSQGWMAAVWHRTTNKVKGSAAGPKYTGVSRTTNCDRSCARLVLAPTSPHPRPAPGWWLNSRQQHGLAANADALSAELPGQGKKAGNTKAWTEEFRRVYTVLFEIV
eukprot:5030634-Amphidinium_carterae.1